MIAFERLLILILVMLVRVITLRACFLLGMEIDQSFEEARELFQRAMDRNERKGGALFELGRMMIKGQGGAKSLGEGGTFIEKSAAKGNKDAIAYLARVDGFNR